MDQERIDGENMGPENLALSPVTEDNNSEMEENDSNQQLISGIGAWQNICVQISRDVEEYCKSNGVDRQFPVDIEYVAKIMGLRVLYVDLNPIEENNIFSISGTTMMWKTMNGDKKNLVCIDSNADKNVQRYSLAYEIGISMLNQKGLSIDIGYNYSVPILPIDSKKFLAEIYAMCLMLPWRALMETLSSYVDQPEHTRPIDNVEWIDYLADQAKMPRNNVCIGFSYISKIICAECKQNEQLKDEYKKILQG